MKILIVEDEPAVAEMIERALLALGKSCVVAHNTDEARNLLAEQQIDGVTLDLAMPGQNGLDWLEGIADSHPELARRTLVITGKWLEGDCAERVARCGAGMLAKPFTLAALHAAVDGQIEHHDRLRD